MELLTYLKIFIAVHYLEDPDEIAEVLNQYEGINFTNLEDSLAMLGVTELDDISEINQFYEKEFDEDEDDIIDAEISNGTRVITSCFLVLISLEV